MAKVEELKSVRTKAVLERLKVGQPVESEIHLSKNINKVNDRVPKVDVWSISFDEFCALAESPVQVNAITQSEIKKAKLELDYFLTGPCTDRRLKSNMEVISVICIDIDKYIPDCDAELLKGVFDKYVELIKSKNWKAILYSTISCSGKDSFRGRLVLFPDIYLSEDYLKRVVPEIIKDINNADIPLLFALESTRIAQPWFLPAEVVGQGNYFSYYQDGDQIDIIKTINRFEESQNSLMKLATDGDDPNQSDLFDQLGMIKYPYNKYKVYMFLNNNVKFFHDKLVDRGDIPKSMIKNGDRIVKASYLSHTSTTGNAGTHVYLHTNGKYYLKCFHEADPLSYKAIYRGGEEIRRLERPAMDCIEFGRLMKYPENEGLSELQSRKKFQEGHLEKVYIENVIKLVLDRYVLLPTDGGSAVFELRGPAVVKTSKASFNDRFENLNIFTDDGKPIPISIMWRRNINRKTVDDINWVPQAEINSKNRIYEEEGLEVLNIYSAPMHRKPDHFDQWEIFKHIHDKIYGEDAHLFMQVWAFMLQEPDIRPKVVPISICLKEGMGRNWLASVLKHCVGSRNASTADLIELANITDKFTYALSRKKFCYVSETREDADSVGTGIHRVRINAQLRKYLTDMDIKTEFKREHAEYKQLCYTIVKLASNNLATIAWSHFDTRFLAHINRTEPFSDSYWKENNFYNLIKDPDFIAQVYWKLREMDISNFSPGRAVKTDSHTEIASMNTDIREQAFKDAVENLDIKSVTDEMLCKLTVVYAASNKQEYKKLSEAKDLAKMIRVWRKKYFFPLVDKDMPRSRIGDKIHRVGFVTEDAFKNFNHPSTKMENDRLQAEHNKRFRALPKTLNGVI